jgi:dihydrofolate synthase/folylpolyglutamate synthase
MTEKFSPQQYDLMLENLFKRFPSFQKDGASAYKPGIANMEFIDQLMGHPHRNYRIVHVAGTNGKGSVSNMLTSALAACGLKVGLYTSPHILDFRERMRVVYESGAGVSDVSLYRLVSKQYVWDFMQQWRETFDHLDLSFFEITTMLALQWFADEKVDVVVLETGLGGRLDSTNIVTPVLSVITNIGLDHCDMLGETLPEIAFEKAGIIKPRLPVVVGESNPETDSVFERKVLYTNLPEPSFMGNRNSIMSLLTYADKVEPTLWPEHEDILAHMDLQGAYQRNNLRTVLAALDVLAGTCHDIAGKSWQVPSSKVGSATLYEEKCARSLRNAIISTAKRTGFRGRWEKLSDKPLVICDIGHNEHGLRYNFSQLEQMRSAGKCSDLIVVYGSVADKDVDAVLELMPHDAIYIFTQAHGKRALSAEKIREKFVASGCKAREVSVVAEVAEAVARAKEMAAGLSGNPLIYIGGSTYVVSEAIAAIQCKAN